MEWRRGPSTTTTAATAVSQQSQPASTAAVASSSSPTKGGAMFSGTLDEDKEHEVSRISAVYVCVCIIYTGYVQ